MTRNEGAYGFPFARVASTKAAAVTASKLASSVMFFTRIGKNCEPGSG